MIIYYQLYRGSGVRKNVRYSEDFVIHRLVISRFHYTWKAPSLSLRISISLIYRRRL